MMIDTARAWYALTVLTGREMAVAAEIRDLSQHAYVPYVSKDMRGRRGSRKRYQRAVPLCPGYAFLGLDSQHAWPAILDLDDVLGVVSAGRIPLRLSDRGLMQLADMREPDPVDDALRPGDLVEVIDGPLAGHIVRLRDHVMDKRTVSIEMLKGWCKVRVPAASIRRAA